MLRSTFLLAWATGWTEQQILSLPVERFNTYVDLLNDLYPDK